MSTRNLTRAGRRKTPQRKAAQPSVHRRDVETKQGNPVASSQRAAAAPLAALKPASIQGLQRIVGNRAVQRALAERSRPQISGQDAGRRVMRDEQGSEASAAPTEAEYREGVEDRIAFFAVAREADSLAAVQAGAETPEGTLQEIRRILSEWQKIYDWSRQAITTHLAGDEGLSERLRENYLGAIEALHRSVREDMPRVNINLIAAAGPGADIIFLTDAAAYARSYYSSPPEGDIVVTQDNIGTLDELFGTVEGTHLERLIRRVDIFAHGTIEPTNQIKLGSNWYGAEEIEGAASARSYESSYIQSIARFDEHSKMELHACRLGGGDGEAFLTGMGEAVGGRHGQEVAGYTQRWHPRNYTVSWSYTGPGPDFNESVTNTENDIYGPDALPDRNGHSEDHDPFVARFEARAIDLFDSVVAGSLEVDSYLSEEERAGGEVTRERKIEIMRAMYDQNEGWLLSFLHPRSSPGQESPITAIGKEKFTFTRETEAWENRMLRVRIPSPE